jgi:hypothetical protein
VSPNHIREQPTFSKKQTIMHNVGKIDRIIRLSVAAILVTLYFTHVLDSKFFLGAAVVLAFTSLNRCCPLYAILGLGTCGVNTGKSERKIETDKLDLK